MSTDEGADGVSEEWAEAVVAPLREKDAELGVAARHHVVEAGKALDDTEKLDLAERFRVIDRSESGWGKLLGRGVVLIAILLTVVVTTGAFRLYKIANTVSGVGTLAGTSYDPSQAFASELSPDKKLFVFGDTSQPTPELAALALWKSRPEDPRLYQNYLDRQRYLPPDLLETAADIDPENGWYHLLAAGELARKAIDKKFRAPVRPVSKLPNLKDWTILDEAAYHEALDLVDEALAKDHIRYYGGDLLQERLRMLPPEVDAMSRLNRFMFAAGESPTAVFNLLLVGDLLSGQAYFAGREGDAGTVATLIPKARAYSLSLANQNAGLVHQLIIQGTSLRMTAHLAEACGKVGMEAEQSSLDAQVAALEAIRSRDPGPGFDDLKMRAGMLAAMGLPAVGSFGVEDPTPAELEASRMVDFALFDQVSAIAAALLFVALALDFLAFSRIRGRLTGQLGFRFTQLLGFLDRCWIFVLGIILPVGGYLVLVMLTPLGARDWSLMGFLTLPMSMQLLAAFLLTLSCSLVAGRWQLRRVMGGLARPAVGKGELVPVGALVLALPLAGFTHSVPALGLYGAGALVLLSFLWLLVIALRAYGGKGPVAVYRNALARILVPVMAAAALLMVGLYPLARQAERKWIARDTLMATTPENFGFGVYERRASEAIKGQVLEILGPEGE